MDTEPGDLLATLNEEENIQLAELAALVETALGQPLADSMLRELAAIQADIRNAYARIDRQFEEGTLTSEDCLNQLEAVIVKSMERCVLLLGDAKFDAIFGEAARHPKDLIYHIREIIRELG